MTNPPFITSVLFLIALLFTGTLFFDKLIKFWVAFRKGEFDTPVQTTELSRQTKKQNSSSPAQLTDSVLIPASSTAEELLGESRIQLGRSQSSSIPSLSTASGDYVPNLQKQDPESLERVDQDQEDDEDDEVNDDQLDDINDDLTDEDQDTDTLSEDEKPVVIPSSTFSQFKGNDLSESDWDQQEDVPLDIEPDGIEEYDLAQLNEQEDQEVEGIRADIYLNRLDIVRTSIYNIGQAARRKERKQTADLLCQNLVSLVNHYKMNWDRNVGNLIRTEQTKVETNSEVFEERMAFYVKLQNSILSGVINSEEE